MTKTKSILPIWQATFILTNCHVEKEPLTIKMSYGEIHIVNEDSEKEKRVRVSINVMDNIEKNEIVRLLNQKIVDFYACLLPNFAYSTFSVRQKILNVDIKLANINDLIRNLGKKVIEYSLPPRFNSNLTIYFTEKNIMQIEKNFKIMENLPVRIKQILSLYLSALQSEQPYAAIALFWTSFEMIYKYEKQGEDVPLINDYIYRKISREFFSKILELVIKPIYMEKQQSPLQISLMINFGVDNIASVLTNLDLLDKRRQKNFSDDLKNLIVKHKKNIKNNNPRKLLCTLFRCLYSIRSNIVHGDEDFYNKVNRNQAKVLSDIFRIIIGTILNNFIGLFK